MVRDSRSPPPREQYRDQYRGERDRKRGYDESNRDDSRKRYRESDRDDRRYDRRREDDSDRRRRGDSPGRGGGYSREVNRRVREPEREKPREDRDRPTTSRRSASPPRRSQSQSHRSEQARDPRSKSKSVDPEDKAKPNFNPSGLLAAATKTVQHADGTGTVLKYHEPPEARKPLVGWRLYVFKGKEQVGEFHFCR